MKIYYNNQRLQKLESEVKATIFDLYYRDLEKAVRQLRSRKSFVTNLAFIKAKDLKAPRGSKPLGAFLGYVFENFIDNLSIRIIKKKDSSYNFSYKSYYFLKTFKELNNFTSPYYVNDYVASIYIAIESKVFKRFEKKKGNFVFYFTNKYAQIYNQESMILVNKASVNVLEYENILKDLIITLIERKEKRIREKRIKKELGKIIPKSFRNVIEDIKKQRWDKVSLFLLKNNIDVTIRDLEKIRNLSEEKIYNFLQSKKTIKVKRIKDFIESIFEKYNLGLYKLETFKKKYPTKYLNILNYIKGSPIKEKLVLIFALLLLNKGNINKIKSLVLKYMADENLRILKYALEIKKMI